MQQETAIAESIRATDGNAQYDAACKRLLSDRHILAWIVQSCLDEFRDISVEDIAKKYIEGEPQISNVAVAPDETNAQRIQGIGTEDATLTEGTVTYDIRFVVSVPGTGELIRMIVNVEAQNAFRTGYPLIKRAIYYCSRMISSQYGVEFSHSQYQKIKKVYSIWLVINPPQERENTITRYRITEENVIGHVAELPQDYDLMTVVMVCLGSPEEGQSKILRLLSVLLSSKAKAEEKKHILEEEFSIPMTQTLERSLSDMCNLSEGVMERGRAEGTIKTWLDSIQNLMKSTGWPIEQVVTALNIPEEERKKCLALLVQQ